MVSKKCRIFISHASVDSKIITPLVDLIRNRFKLSTDAAEIMYTSLPDTGLENGNSFNEELRNALYDSEIVIIFLTQNYIKSEYCLCELGAIWVLRKNIFLINKDMIQKNDIPDVASGITYNQFNNECLDALYDKLKENGFNPESEKILTWNSQKIKTIQDIQNALNLPYDDAIKSTVSNNYTHSFTHKNIEDKLTWTPCPIQIVKQYIPKEKQDDFKEIGKSAYISEPFLISEQLDKKGIAIFMYDGYDSNYYSWPKSNFNLLLIDKKTDSLITYYPRDNYLETDKQILSEFELYIRINEYQHQFPFSPQQEKQRQEDRIKKNCEAFSEFLDSLPPPLNEN